MYLRDTFVSHVPKMLPVWAILGFLCHWPSKITIMN